MSRPIILALPKGRILEESAAVFARAGYDLSPVLGDSRRLMHDCGILRVLVLRNSDVVTFVGAAIIISSGVYTAHRERVRRAQIAVPAEPYPTT